MSDEEPLTRGDDPIRRRMERLIEAKRRHNDQTVAALKRWEGAWNDLNKGVDEALGHEFELMTVEERAVKRARRLPVKGPPPPKSDGFTFSGRVLDEQKQAGLPGVRVRILREKEDQEEILAEADTDEAGSFTAIVAKELIPPVARVQETVRVVALADAGAPVHLEERSVCLRPGESEEIELRLPASAELAGREAAAISIRDSVEHSAKAVARRMESMRAAHTAVTHFADITRAGLRKLREELSVVPPTPSLGTGETVEGPAAPGSPSPGTEPPAETPVGKPARAELPGLEDIDGVGKARAARLREAGIKDLEGFRAADEKTLRGILGRLNITEMKRNAARLLATALEEIPGIGHKRASEFRRAGIITVGDLRKAEEKVLRAILGDIGINEVNETSARSAPEPEQSGRGGE